MIAASPTKQEDERIRELEKLHILDSLEEDEYDTITQLASTICETPISLISLVDTNRQWFKSHKGLEARETPKEYAFCAHAIHSPHEVFEITDSRKDERFHDNPLVTGEPRVIFYAGVPLVTNDGQAVGTLCVIDHETNKLSDDQHKALRALAKQVVQLFNLRIKTIELENIHKEVSQKNEELEVFARNAAHDLKSPLSSIIGLSTALLNNCKNDLEEEDYMLVKMIDSSSRKLHQMIEGLLQFYKNQALTLSVKEQVPVHPFFQNLKSLFEHVENLEIEIKSGIDFILINETALNQISLNLLSNAIKYCDKDVIKIEVKVGLEDGHYQLQVADNGPGIPNDFGTKIFEPFEVGKAHDRFGIKGSGIGLSAVQELLQKMNGSLRYENNKNEVGATFIAEWPE